MGDLFLIRVFKHGLYQRKSVTLAMAFCVVHLPSKSFIELWRWGFYVGKSMPVEKGNAPLDMCTNKHLIVDLIDSEFRADNHASTLEVCK